MHKINSPDGRDIEAMESTAPSRSDLATTTPGDSDANRRGGISLFTATCIVIANMIGTGIFTSLGFQVGDLPSGFTIVALWTLGGLCALCGALSYGELAATLQRSGGEYHFLSVIFHPVVGFVAGWLSITAGFAAPVALAAIAFGRYFNGFAPGVDATGLSIAVVVAVMVIHLCGVGIGSAFQNAATILKVSLVAALVVAGFSLGESQPISFLPSAIDGPLLASTPFAVSLIYVMYAYSGWNASTYIVGEVRHPGRTVPLSIAIGTLIVTVLYVGVNAAFLRSTPISEMAGKVEVAHVAAAHIFGPTGGRIMAALICGGLVSTISAMTWVGPRVAMAMGEDWRALRWLAIKNRTGVPTFAIVAQTILVVLLITLGSFDAVLTYVQFSLQLCSFLAVLGVIVLRFTRPELPRPYKTWGYPITPLIFLAVSAWMMGHILLEKPMESLSGLATLLVGAVVYWISVHRRTADRKQAGL